MGRLVLGIASTLVCLLVAELATRWLLPVPLHTTDTFLHLGDARLRRDESAPVWLRAGVRTRHQEEDFSVTVAVNSKGLRDREMAYAKPPGVRRLLSVGDSFAFGYGVELDEAFCKVAAAELGPPWEAINAGVPSWGTGDELDFLLTEGFRYEPDVVVLTCFFENDLRDNWNRQRYTVGADGRARRVRPLEQDLRERTSFDGVSVRNPLLKTICERGAPADATEPAAPAPPRVSWWIAHSNLARMVRRAISRTEYRTREQAMQEAAHRDEAERRALGAALLTEIARQCRAHDTPLVILLMPSKKELAWNDGPGFRAAYDDVVAGAEQWGATIVDLAPPLRELGIQTAYFGNDPHINAAGHRAVGHVLARAVRSAWRGRGGPAHPGPSGVPPQLGPWVDRVLGRRR